MVNCDRIHVVHNFQSHELLGFISVEHYERPGLGWGAVLVPVPVGPRGIGRNVVLAIGPNGIEPPAIGPPC